MRARDVFGLFSISRKSGQRLLRVDVYPRAHDVPFMELKAGDTGPELRSRATEDTASPSDVRKWQEGDVLKKVHWKLTMRRRELMVRTFEESSRPDTLIVPDLSEIQALPDQALTMEDCVCEACLSPVSYTHLPTSATLLGAAMPAMKVTKMGKRMRVVREMLAGLYSIFISRSFLVVTRRMQGGCTIGTRAI